MGHNMYMFGGHDGARQLNDFYIFDFGTENWQLIDLSGQLIPSPRDSHVLLTHSSSIYLFGGCTRQRKRGEGRLLLDDSRIHDSACLGASQDHQKGLEINF